MKHPFRTLSHTSIFCPNITLSFLLGLTSANWSFAQNSKQLNGKIIDQQTKAAIPFAHVGIPKLGTGVVSNEEGYFTFYYPQSAENDTLLVSFLGYKTAHISLKKYAAQTQNDTLKIALSPDVIGLQEVVITNNSDSAKAILKRALARLKKNYPTTVFQMNAFFREKVQNRDDYRFTQLLEGMIDIRDWGIKSHPDKIRIRLNEFRKSDDHAKRNFTGSIWKKMVGSKTIFMTS
jgi:CarboxypepD_reg-like domain